MEENPSALALGVCQLNGSAVGTPVTSSSSCDTTSTMRLGCKADSSTFFNGKIDEWYAWKGLSFADSDEMDTMVSNLYNGDSGRYLRYDYTINSPYPSGHLIAVWTMQERTGDRLDDKNSLLAEANGTIDFSYESFDGQIQEFVVHDVSVDEAYITADWNGVIGLFYNYDND